LRGINTLTALGLGAEIGDWRRFDHPDSIARYVGLVPSEHSSGQTRRLGKITKAGSTHARRLLVEAALHYRLAPSVGGKLAVRQRGQDPALIDHAWRVQRRLNARWNLLRQAGRDRDHRDRPRARRRLLGDRHRALNPTTSVWRVEAARRSGYRAHTNVRAFACEPPTHLRVAPLDSRQRTLRRTEVLRPLRGLAHEADQASRRPAPRAAPTRQTTPRLNARDARTQSPMRP
jgi:hypothetical protein